MQSTERAKPLTSVVMVSRETGPMLSQAMRAVLASTVAVELILVDNGNSPEVVAKLKKWAATEPRLKLVTGHGDVGYYAACNKGAEASSGVFLLFLSARCLLPPDAIERLYAEEASLKPPFVLGARLVRPDGKLVKYCRSVVLTPRTAAISFLHLYRFFPKEQLKPYLLPLPKKTEPVSALCRMFMFMRAEHFRALRGFDPRYDLHVGDVDFCCRFQRNGGTLYFVPHIAVTYDSGRTLMDELHLSSDKMFGFMRFFHENYGHDVSQPLLWALDLVILARFGWFWLLAKGRRVWAQRKKVFK